jgi:hypothetical protein
LMPAIGLPFCLQVLHAIIQYIHKIVIYQIVNLFYGIIF